MRAPDARRLPEQVETVLRVHAEEARRVELLRAGGRGDRRPGGPAGPPGPGAGGPGTEPEGDREREPGPRPPPPPLGAAAGAGVLRGPTRRAAVPRGRAREPSRGPRAGAAMGGRVAEATRTLGRI